MQILPAPAAATGFTWPGVAGGDLVEGAPAGTDLAIGATATASGGYATFVAGNINDGDDSTYWMPGDNGLTTQWARLDIGTPQLVQSARILSLTPSAGGRRPLAAPNWTLQGSNSGTAWTDLVTFPFIQLDANQDQTLSFVNTTPYRYYRIYSTSVGHGDVIFTLSLYGAVVGSPSRLPGPSAAGLVLTSLAGTGSAGRPVGWAAPATGKPPAPKVNLSPMAMSPGAGANAYGGGWTMGPGSGYAQLTAILSVTADFAGIAAGEVVTLRVRASANNGSTADGFVTVNANGRFSVPPDQLAVLHQWASDLSFYIVGLNFSIASSIAGSVATATIPSYGALAIEAPV